MYADTEAQASKQNGQETVVSAKAQNLIHKLFAAALGTYIVASIAVRIAPYYGIAF